MMLEVPYLIIFDNADSVDNKSLLAQFWPRTGKGSILITSRDRSLLGEFPGQSLTQFPSEDAVKLLVGLTNQGSRVAGDAHRESEAKAAAKLADLVHCLPLAITQLASIAIEDCCSLADLGSSYDNLSQLIEDSSSGNTITGALSQYSHSLKTVLDMNYGRLNKNEQALLNIMSFLDPDRIQFSLLTGGVGDAAQQQHGVFQSKLQLVKARGFLLKSSLLYENADLSVIWMHRLVQATCQLRMLGTDLEARQKAFDSAFNLVHKAFPVPPITGRHDKTYWEPQEACLAHIQSLGAIVQDSELRPNTRLEVDPARFSQLLHDAAW